LQDCNPDGLDFTSGSRIIRSMAKKRAEPAELPLWEISRIKGTPAAILGRISAPNAERAVEEWAEKFGITDEHQKSRLVARPVK
jgi:hypothetical protein